MTSDNPIEILRSGNLLKVNLPDKRIVQLLDPFLSYEHKRSFHGYELQQRLQQRRENPGVQFNPHFEVSRRKLYSVQDGALICGAGLKNRITDTLDKFNIAYTYTDMRKNKLPPADWPKLAGVSLRYKQDEALARIDACDGGIIQAPTGFGKSFIASMVCKVYPKSRIAFIAPGLSLLDSLHKKLQSVIPGDVGRIGGGKHEPDKRVLLCSADSLHKVPLPKMHLVIFDEVHSCASDKRASAITAQYTDAKFIGFSASAEHRMDGADAVVASIFGPIMLDISYEEAQKHGMVAPINTVFINIPESVAAPRLEGQGWQKKRDGYWTNNNRNLIIADFIQNKMYQYLDKSNTDPQILLMVETVEHAYHLKNLLPDFDVVYSTMNDKLRARLIRLGVIDEDHEELTEEQRSTMLSDFESGKLRRVIATHCWKQGIDPTHLTVFGRLDGGASDINNIQLPGRLSRIEEGKCSGLLVDTWDAFDPWALNRSKSRRTAYKKGGFNILD